jgi:hypothetical protein
MEFQDVAPLATYPGSHRSDLGVRGGTMSVTLRPQRPRFACGRQKLLERRRECYRFCRLLAKRLVCSILATADKNTAVPGQIASISVRLEEIGCHTGGHDATPREQGGLI